MAPATLTLMAGTVLCVALLARWLVGQRQARRLCRQQESPHIDASFDVMPGMGGAGGAVLARPAPWKRRWWGVSVPERETWYCLAGEQGCVAITACYRRAGWGWRVRWDVQVLPGQDSRGGLPHHARSAGAVSCPVSDGFPPA